MAETTSEITSASNSASTSEQSTPYATPVKREASPQTPFKLKYEVELGESSNEMQLQHRSLQSSPGDRKLIATELRAFYSGHRYETRGAKLGKGKGIAKKQISNYSKSPHAVRQRDRFASMTAQEQELDRAKARERSAKAYAKKKALKIVGFAEKSVEEQRMIIAKLQKQKLEEREDQGKSAAELEFQQWLTLKHNAETIQEEEDAELDEALEERLQHFRGVDGNLTSSKIDEVLPSYNDVYLPLIKRLEQRAFADGKKALQRAGDPDASSSFTSFVRQVYDPSSLLSKKRYAIKQISPKTEDVLENDDVSAPSGQCEDGMVVVDEEEIEDLDDMETDFEEVEDSEDEVIDLKSYGIDIEEESSDDSDDGAAQLIVI